MRTVLLSLLLFSPLLLCRALPAQGLPAPGFALSVRTGAPGAPGAFTGFDLLPGGDLLLLSGSDAVLATATPPRVVFSFPVGTMGAFVRNTACGLFLAESTLGSVLLIDPDSGWFREVVRVGFPFDLAEGPAGELYLSANPGFGTPSSGSRIYLLDPVKGALDEIVRLPGPSGPVAVDGAGALYCAVQSAVYPTPPGAVKVLCWTAAQVKSALGPGQLTEQAAAVAWAGLDGAFGLAVDRMGRLYATDPQKGGVLRFDPGDRSVERLLGATPLTATGHASIRIYAGPGPATLDAYQPAGAGSILVAASDYLTFARVEELRPARPALSSSPWPEVPVGGQLRFALSGAPPGGPVVLLLSPAALPGEAALFLGGRAPLFLGVGPHYLALALVLGADAAGKAALQARYPGGGPMDLFAQAFPAGGPAGLFGSSNPWGVRLR